jgi:hypothetical protein
MGVDSPGFQSKEFFGQRRNSAAVCLPLSRTHGAIEKLREGWV